MIKIHEPYQDARSVESAIKDAAKRAAVADPSMDTNKRIQVEYFNRFLSRVFSEGDDSEWVLKGGTGMLARIPSTRSTVDIDLYRRGFTLEQSLHDLTRLASIDLNDHFRFVYSNHESTIFGDAQPYTNGVRVTFNVFIGVGGRGVVKVDLVSGAAATGEVQSLQPVGTLDLPRLTSYRYRLYPVVDQIADKVCAAMSAFDGRPSSREKDLVDIVVLAATQNIDGAALSHAVESERRRRRLDLFKEFTVPGSWGRGYNKLSRGIPHCDRFRSVELAAELASRLMNPVFSGEATGKTWSADSLQWE